VKSVNDGTKQLLIRYLAEQKMFNIIELLIKGADDTEIMELFKKNVLYQSPQYQSMLLQMNFREKVPQERWDFIVDLCLKQQLYQIHKNQQIFRLLQKLDQFNNYDCGCDNSTLNN
jgi:hypothetical protein